MINEHFGQLRAGIEAFRAGRLNLPALTNHLYDHTRALDVEMAGFLAAFRSEWQRLEILTAQSLDESERGHPTDLSKPLTQTVQKLSELIDSVIVNDSR